MRQPRSVYDARWKARHPGYKAPYYPGKARENYLNNREKRLAQANERYRSMTPGQREEHNRKRRERHARQPEVRNRVERVRDHNKRAHGSLTKDVWGEVCRRYADTCIYCGSKENITIEHLLPVSRGGTNDASNLAPACLGCNSSKRNKTYEEFLAWRQQRLF